MPRSQAIEVNLPRKWIECRDDDGTPLDPAKCLRFQELARQIREGNAPAAQTDQTTAQPKTVKQKRMTAVQRAASLAAVTADTIKRLATTGEAFVSDEVIEARLAICKSCEQFDGSRCKLCGCGCGTGRNFANKVAHASSACPYDPPKWGAVQ